jgi:ABC-type polar amino acid transport system ATPase subunit
MAFSETTDHSKTLKASNISKQYDGLSVLGNVDIEVKPSEILALCGPSGSGKSTLLRIMAGLDNPDAGTVQLGDIPVNRRSLRSKELRGKIGFVFQRPGLYPHMTALENVALALRLARGLSKSEASERARSSLRRVGVDDKADALPATLSGGQQQRVAIARTLALDPNVLLLDEPTSALDPERIREVLDVLRRLAADGTTMVVVTHELGFAREVAGRIAFMDEGKILELSSTKDFFEAPATDRARRFLDQIFHH